MPHPHIRTCTHTPAYTHTHKLRDRSRCSVFGLSVQLLWMAFDLCLGWLWDCGIVARDAGKRCWLVPVPVLVGERRTQFNFDIGRRRIKKISNGNSRKQRFQNFCIRKLNKMLMTRPDKPGCASEPVRSFPGLSFFDIYFSYFCFIFEISQIWQNLPYPFKLLMYITFLLQKRHV